MEARVGTAARLSSLKSGPAVRIVTGGAFLSVFSILATLALAGAAWAQRDVNLPVPADVMKSDRQAPPAIAAEVTGTDVNIRSGPGTNFYDCGRLNKGDRVQVVKTSQGWSAIVPPPGSYSWVAVQYVGISVQNPMEGVVTGTGVPVYAGSDNYDPMVSTSKQEVVLNRGMRVRLLNEEKDEYYKIIPPPGAYLWVSSQYLQSAGGPGTPLPTTPRVAQQPPVSQGAAAPPNEASLIGEFYALRDRIVEEQKKPVDQQDYTAVKEKLKALADNKDAGRAARYAQYTLKQVERFELAGTVAKELELQNQDLQKTTANIDAARAARLAQIEDLGKFAVIGRLEKSAIYSASSTGQVRRYQLLDDSGRILCYVAPAGAATGKDLTPYIGHKVGLVGQIVPNSATSRTFVEFSDIVRKD